jgi:phosphomannomutase
VVHLTQLEVYINVLAELEYLQSLAPEAGGVARGGEVYVACDLRPSSTRLVPEQGGRGEIAQAVVRAIEDAGMRPVNLGRIPTPALACYAWERRRASIMVTGSHIPFDRNGYKTNTSRGELLKEHEEPIAREVARVRAAVYEQPFSESPFDERGMFRGGHRDLPAETDAAARAYVARYTSFFAGQPLTGLRLLVYQHSAVGRDLLVEILEGCGAEAIPAGRSETFVPIDTENIDDAQLMTIRNLVRPHAGIDAVVSTDGDSDRPLVLGVDRATGGVRFFGGDLVGMVVAEYLGADAVVVPISCNDAIDRGRLAAVVEPKTRIGSPYVVAGMEEALRKGRRAVCGWEANGGFLTGSDFTRRGARLPALPTRDAVLPILGVLLAAREQACPVAGLFDRLPRRFSRAALLKQFPRPLALEIMARFSPRESGGMDAVRARLAAFFPARLGFGPVDRVDSTDGVRITFVGGDVAHIRPSGNADELRIYAVADTQERADAIARAGVAEPDGILRRMASALESK